MSNKALTIILIFLVVAVETLGITYVMMRIGGAKEPEKEIQVVSVPLEETPMDEAECEKYKKQRGVIEVTEIPSVEEYEVPSEFNPIDCKLDEDLQAFTYSIAQAYNMDFDFLMAVMFNESAFDPNCISRTNDYGLMQINKCNHKWLSEELGITDFLEPHQSIIAGAYIYAGLFEKHGDNTNKVLMSYNMGEDSAKRLWDQGIYETSYTRKISSTMAEYKERESNEG